MTPFGISGLLAGISSLCFGCFVLFKSQDRKIAKIWFVFSLSVAVWGVTALCIGMNRDLRFARLIWLFGYAFGVLWISALFYHFVCIFLNIDRRTSILAHYLIGGIFLAFLPTSLFFKRIVELWGSMYFVRSGPVHYLFCVWWVGLVIYSHYLLFRSYGRVASVKRQQIKYFFLASAIGFGGGASGFLVDFGFSFYPWGEFTVCLYPVIMALAIVKYRLMDVNVIIRKTLIYSAATLSLTMVYVTLLIFLTKVLAGWVGTPNVYSSAIAAVVIAILFHPVRSHIQAWMDRHFPRESLNQTILREATGRFVHEIKRPLTNISLPTQLSLMNLQDLKQGRRSAEEVLSKVEQHLRYILDQTQDASGKIEAIREFSESDAKRADDLNLSEVIHKAISAERDSIEQAHIQLKVEIADFLAIRGHAKQLEIVFSNLLKNAVDAMQGIDDSKGRCLRVSAHGSETTVSVDVEDTGPGIKPETMARLFEPYFTTKGAQGMGIGLYLCRQIIQSHDGSIEVQNLPEQGCRFRIQLPSAI